MGSNVYVILRVQSTDQLFDVTVKPFGSVRPVTLCTVTNASPLREALTVPPPV